MATRNTQTTVGARGQLFDRYLLPKIALVVILSAALVGTWLSSTLQGQGEIWYALTKWSFFVSLGVLTGGLVWRHLFVEPSQLGEGTIEYCEEMYRRFDRIAIAAIIIGGSTGAIVFHSYLGRFGTTSLVIAHGGLLLALFGAVAVPPLRNRSVQARFRSPGGLLALSIAILTVVLTAILEVGNPAVDPLAAGYRVIHLLAFAVWVGGAVWNIFVAVPTGQRRPNIPVVRAAASQLERFRWAVRFIIPLLILTGLFQAVDLLGTTLTNYVGSYVGLAVLAKLGFIGLLVTIFKLCPMWRACSPIEGVCDLEEISPDAQTPDSHEVTADD